MGIVCIIPFKGTFNSKTRLSGILTPSERKELSLHMLRQVMEVVYNNEKITERILLGGDFQSRKLTLDFGFSVMPDKGKGLNQNLCLALRELDERGAGKILILPGDVPLINNHSLNIMIQTASYADAVISPSHDRKGTNGLLLLSNFWNMLCYGECSFNKHLKAFENNALSVEIFECPFLAWDIDTPDDYHYWKNYLKNKNSI